METFKKMWSIRLKLWNEKLVELAKASSYAIHR